MFKMYVPAIFGLMLAASVTGQVEITPREAVRREGDDLTVLCKVAYPIDSCRMTVGTTPYRLIPNNQDGDVVYAGQGLQFGECGAHIKRIRGEWNGNITCTVPPPSGSIELTAAMRLLVAQAPQAPQLITPEQPNFHEGEHLEAQCIVPRGRPAAKITWYLDEEQLLAGVHQPIVTSEPDSDLQTVSQNVSRVLKAEDAGRTLRCRAEHEALDAPRDVSRQLIVNYPPKRTDGDSNQITIFGLKLGAEGRLNVSVRASPPPAAEWQAGGARLSAPAQNEDGSIVALPPQNLGVPGVYNVTLILRRVSKEDVERSYHLRLRNELGAAEYVVRISTLDEPAGVELGTGAIVGIVVAVLVLLAAVFLAVFAKATDRWCFAGGRGRDHAKNSGESDTESAAGGRGERERGRLAALSARVRAALPRGRDKVQASERAQEEEKPADEKKGVVYAELALGEPPAADKPAPAQTEYAEIVYTEQGQKEAKE